MRESDMRASKGIVTRPAPPRKRRAEGFGYTPEDGSHRFTVEMKAEGPIFLYYHINGGMRHVAAVPRNKWEKIADPVKAEFNRVLDRDGYTLGRWKVGETPVCPTMGKELLLLARAIEDCPVERILNVLNYWKGLHPCERWWLCTQSQATHEGPHDERKGWRMAIKYALGAID